MTSKRNQRIINRDYAFEGRIALINLLKEKKYDWRQIRQHPDAQQYLSFHKQAKMMIIKHLIENNCSSDEIIKTLNYKIE